MNAVFLRAEWRYLIMANFAVDPHLLQRYLPQGTQIDYHRGLTFVSLVGFMFQKTAVMGIPVPFHRNFEEVNLRFYVTRESPEGLRRGVVFIREIVPRNAIAWVARHLYNEPYVAFPMRHKIQQTPQQLQVEYSWRRNRVWESMSLEAGGPAKPLENGSEEEFISEHYWGYTRHDGGTSEYQVEHGPWKVWRGSAWKLKCDAGSLYGPQLAGILAADPTSTFIADGSEVTVRRGSKIA